MHPPACGPVAARGCYPPRPLRRCRRRGCPSPCRGRQLASRPESWLPATRGGRWMRKLLIALTGAALIAGAGALVVPAAAATTCTGALSGSVSGPVTVPSGHLCTLDHANVSGAVNVNPGGRLFIKDSLIDGSV